MVVEERVERDEREGIYGAALIIRRRGRGGGQRMHIDVKGNRLPRQSLRVGQSWPVASRPRLRRRPAWEVGSDGPTSRPDVY